MCVFKIRMNTIERQSHCILILLNCMVNARSHLIENLKMGILVLGWGIREFTNLTCGIIFWRLGLRIREGC